MVSVPIIKLIACMKNNNTQKITEKEIAIIKKAKEGDEKSFNKLFKKYKKFVEGVLYSYLNDMDEAKDIANIVFLKVYNKLASFTEYESFGGWLRIITNRTAIDYLRERKKKEVYVDDESVLLPLSKAAKHTEYEVADRMTYEQIISEFKKFPDNVCKELEMFYVDNLTTEQISEKLRIPEGTIKSHLSRARSKLKTILN